MSSMYLALGYKCNHRCYFCPCGNNEIKTDAASLEELKKAINEGAEAGVTHITLSGGEPTLHSHFNEILNFCISRSMNVGILSNGDTFNNEQNIDIFFKNTDLSRVNITTAIHSINPSSHDKVTRVNKSFERTISGLKKIIKRGIPITVKQVISKWNYSEMPDFVDFVFKEYGPYASLTLCGMDFCGMKPEQINEVAIDYKSIKLYLEEALDRVIAIRKKLTLFLMFQLQTFRFVVLIRTTGDSSGKFQEVKYRSTAHP